jgi:hypothetical protein
MNYFISLTIALKIYLMKMNGKSLINLVLGMQIALLAQKN